MKIELLNEKELTKPIDENILIVIHKLNELIEQYNDLKDVKANPKLTNILDDYDEDGNLK